MLLLVFYNATMLIIHRRKSSDMSLDPEVSLTSDTASALLFNAGLLGGGVAGGGSVFEEVVMEMDKLSVEETRDLLISALFILKHLDTRKQQLLTGLA